MTARLLRGSEVAEMLNISKTLAYRLMAQGAIPSIRFGRSVRVRPDDLEAFIAQNTSGFAADPLNARPAAVTASPERDQASHTKKAVTHGQ